MEHQEIQFTRGFNSGYIMAKYLPELKSKINKSLKNVSDYSHGFLLGSKEYEIEKMNELQRLRTRSKDKGRNLGKEI